MLLEQGLPVAEVAARLRVSAEIVYRWRRAIAAGGVDALSSKGSSDASCRLTEEQLRRLGEELDCGPVVHGFGPVPGYCSSPILTCGGWSFIRQQRST